MLWLYFNQPNWREVDKLHRAAPSQYGSAKISALISPILFHDHWGGLSSVVELREFSNHFAHLPGANTTSGTKYGPRGWDGPTPDPAFQAPISTILGSLSRDGWVLQFAADEKTLRLMRLEPSLKTRAAFPRNSTRANAATRDKRDSLGPRRCQKKK